jgi:hypothetical protein
MNQALYAHMNNKRKMKKKNILLGQGVILMLPKTEVIKCYFKMTQKTILSYFNPGLILRPCQFCLPFHHILESLTIFYFLIDPELVMIQIP